MYLYTDIDVMTFGHYWAFLFMKEVTHQPFEQIGSTYLRPQYAWYNSILVGICVVEYCNAAEPLGSRFCNCSVSFKVFKHVHEHYHFTIIAIYGSSYSLPFGG